jgi:hypothetical protein
MRSLRGPVALLVVVSALLVAGVGGSVLGTPTLTETPTEGAPTHTLVITTQNGTGSYTVTASNDLHLKRGEQTDYQLRGSRVSGTVGERGDTQDVIRYVGYIESFQADGSIQVTLDGQRIAPTVLGGQHIQIIPAPNSSAPIRYQFAVTGRASRSEQAEQADTVTNRRIRGQVQDRADSFYFTGEISNDTITLSEPATVLINGQPANVFFSHAPPTPPATPPPTVTLTPTASMPPSPDARQSPSPTVTSVPTSAAPRSPATPPSSESVGGRFVVGLVGGLIVIGVGMLVVVTLR